MEDPPSLPGIQTERPNPEDHELPRRLVVCLDGTWNKRDSGTSVYHISNLVQEGRVRDPDKDNKKGQEWFQIIYYDEGVGTGLLDGVSGGAFGIGVSENIRQAYDWLVEKYREGDENRPDDRIYIFGFSRGAFTARSLVGLIAKCGLVYRGAPIPPEELWGGYRLLGRHINPRTQAEPSKNWWERLAGIPKIPFRSLWELKHDSWEPDLRRPVEPPKNLAEKLLIAWSRRVRITCVGIFDTVGAMGVDMLAIPWLREKTAQFHDTQLTAMVQNGFHALAIDEHRANFSHIPWRRATNVPWPNDGKIEQRWFIGAHSNVGGGYEDDVLAQFPLTWMLEELRDLGLVIREAETMEVDPFDRPLLTSCVPLLLPEKGDNSLSATPPRARDSFAEIAHGIWKNVVRSKREYRRIAPPLQMENGQPSETVNEFVDPSVWQLLDADKNSPERYNPPNLWAYRQSPSPDDIAVVSQLEPLAAPRHHYLCGFGARVWFIVWIGFISLAGGSLAPIFCDHWHILAWVLALVLPVAAGLADWRESVLNYAVALEPDGAQAERRLAAMDFYLFWRLVFIGLFLTGIVVFIVCVSPWLIRIGPPTPWLLWLIGLDLLMIQFGVSGGWSAAPMTDAGFGSIVQLQKANTPAAVKGLLEQWTGGHSGEKGRQLLAPVRRTLWRDLLGFILSYSILLFLGTWIVLSWFDPQPHRFWMVLSTTFWTWAAAAGLTIACALADCVEDNCHLKYIKQFPNAPGRGLVARAVSATRVKYVLFGLAFSATCGATAWFVWKESVLIFRCEAGSCHYEAGSCHHEAGGIALAVVLFTIALFYSRVRDWISKA
jgi:uncharacterized protein (DUF2235 family)